MKLGLLKLLGMLLCLPVGAEDLGFGYSREGDQILFKGTSIEKVDRAGLKVMARLLGQKLQPCRSVDAASFKPLCEEYARDKNRVYYKWISPGRWWVVELPKADSASLQMVGFNLAKDKNSVWWYGKRQPKVDAATIELVSDGFVWKDAKNVWYQEEQIEGADAGTFERLNQTYYRDAKRVYWCADPLEGADPKTFRIFGEEVRYGADGDKVWFGTGLLEGVHGGSFRPIHETVVADGNAVHLLPHLVPLQEVDVAAFRKLADLDQHRSALLGDGKRYFVYLPWSGQVFRIALRKDCLVASREIWQDGKAGPELIAKSSAELHKRGWENVELKAAKKAAAERVEQLEHHLLKTYLKQFQDAWDILQHRKDQE